MAYFNNVVLKGILTDLLAGRVGGMEEQRNAVKVAYSMLREHYPGLPQQLRDFQVDFFVCV